MSNKWFPEIDGEESALKSSKQGAYGVLIFIAMNLIGVALVYFAEKSPVDGGNATQEDILNHILGASIIIPILLIMAWREFKGKGWLVSILVLLWFIVETALKVLGGTTNIGWVIFYIAVASMLINGIRGCWYIRKISKSENEKIA